MKTTIEHGKEIIDWTNMMGVDYLSFIRLEDFNKNYDKLRISDTEFKNFSENISNINICSMDITSNQRYCDLPKKNNKCDYLLSGLCINDRGKIIPCQEDENPFYLDRPIKELYKDQKFRDYILSKVNACPVCSKQGKAMEGNCAC